LILLPKLPHVLDEDDFSEDYECFFEGPKPLIDWIDDWYGGYGADVIDTIHALVIAECKVLIKGCRLSDDDWCDVRLLETKLTNRQRLMVWRKVIGMEPIHVND